MAKKRPTGVTVIAIMNIVFGAMGLMGSVCGLGQAAVGSALKPPGAGGNNDPATVFEQELAKEDPNNKVVSMIALVVGLFTATGLLFSGIGLLKLRSWARTLAILLAVLEIVIGLANAGYALAVTLPATERAMANTEKVMEAQKNAPGVSEALKVMGMITSMMTALTVGFMVVGLLYYTIVLVILNGAKAKAAFAGAGDGGDDESRDFDDRRRGEPEDIDDRHRD
jgi:hypothetical protein